MKPGAVHRDSLERLSGLWRRSSDPAEHAGNRRKRKGTIDERYC